MRTINSEKKLPKKAVLKMINILYLQLYGETFIPHCLCVCKLVQSFWT